MSRERVKIEITTPFIKLDQLLKFSAIVESGGIAKEIIQNGEVSVNDEICTQRGKKIVKGNKVSLENIDLIII